MQTHNWPWRILLVEDSPADEKMVRRAIEKVGLRCDIWALDDGQQAFDFIDKVEADFRTPCPDLVILDIGLPHHDGIEILKKIRGSDRCGLMPVILMTGSESVDEHFKAAKKNAPHHLFEKKADYQSFLKLGAIIKDLLEPKHENRRKKPRH
jgi:DNA-binding response OmpR family regulator